MFVGALLGGTTALALAALFYLGQQLAGLPFVPFDLFDWLSRNLPGGLLTFVIDLMVRVINGLQLGETSSTAKVVEQSMAILSMVVTGAVLGAAVAWASARTGWAGWQSGLVAGVVLAVPALAVEISMAGAGALGILWTALLILGWGVLLGIWIGRPHETAAGVGEQVASDRRAFLVKVASGSLVLAAVSWGFGRLLEGGREVGGQSATSGSVPGPKSDLSQVALEPIPERQIQPAAGTRPEITPNDDFYRVDINLLAVSVNGQNWRLELDGLFDRTGELTLPEIMAYPAVTQPITLSCISNPIGGDLIGTTEWTGVRLVDFLKDRGLRPEAKQLRLVSSDSFFESVTMEDMMNPKTLLVYGMNGKVLPQEHGYPLRIYIPNRYGMKQPKWIRRMEAIDHEGDGYWVVRGWSKEARPHIVSMIDTIDVSNPASGSVPVGGIAWAGSRGIQKVEVQVDDGPWEEATLLRPPLSPLTWVLWRYGWSPVQGRHTFRVRATDGTGTLQVGEPSSPHPNGATGYHERSITI